MPGLIVESFVLPTLPLRLAFAKPYAAYSSAAVTSTEKLL